MAVKLPPPPTEPLSDGFTWRDWFFLLWKATGTTGLSWLSLDFLGSKLTDIQSRDHNILTNIQGGNGSTQYFHLSSAQVAGLSNYVTAISSVTVTASPFVYQNATGYDAEVFISGGTGITFEFSRDGATWYTIGTTVPQWLSPNDRVRVTYTTPPTMILIPR